MDLKIYPTEKVAGTIELPTSKSQTLRALFSCLFIKGITIIYDALEADDTFTMITCLTSFGLKIIKKQNTLIVHSPGFKQLKAPLYCDVKNSGITLRFLAAFSAFFNTKVTFIGSEALQAQRSIAELEKGLKALGVKVISRNGFCPFSVQGPIKARQCLVKGLDSQPVSALLWILGSLNKRCVIKVLKPSEIPWVTLTLVWLKQQRKNIFHKHFTMFRIKGKNKIKPFVYKVPKDFSSAAFMVGLGIFVGDPVILPGLDFKDPQGDKKLIYLLKQAGANIEKKQGTLFVTYCPSLNLKIVDMQDIIDAVPVICALGIMADNHLHLIGACGARGKESDRLLAMKNNLEHLGAIVYETSDGLIVKKGELKGGICSGFKDHRIAMATAILAAKSKGPIIIQGADCITKTYPRFFEDLKTLGIKIEVLS